MKQDISFNVLFPFLQITALNKKKKTKKVFWSKYKKWVALLIDLMWLLLRWTLDPNAVHF